MAPSGGNNVNSAVAPYPRLAVALHWTIALLLFAELALGWWMPGIAKSPTGARAAWFNVHKSVGILILLVVLLRMAWRASHPQTGLAGSMATRYPIRFFGVALPVWQRDWPAAKALMSDVHNAVAWVFAALISMHVAAALWHWWQRDPVAARMGMPPLPSA